MMNQLLTNKTYNYDGQGISNMVKGSKSITTSIIFLVGAGRIIQDTISNKYSYIDLFDMIIIPKENDFWYQTFYVGGKLQVSQSQKYVIEVKIEDPNKTIIGSVLFPETDLVTGEVPLSAFFALVKVSNAGRHYIRVSVNGEEIKDDRFAFEVVKLGGESGK
jgi:hypothetical protein